MMYDLKERSYTFARTLPAADDVHRPSGSAQMPVYPDTAVLYDLRIGKMSIRN
jgi:hypothetical protein